MLKRKINVYTKMDKIEKIEEFNAIKNDCVIKYIDFENNKMEVDLENNIIKKENIDYLFIIDLAKNNIYILAKKIKRSFNKPIQTLLVEKSKKRYLVRYLLEDENVINEYCVNF